MHRNGVRIEELDKALEVINSSKLFLKGVFTHFANIFEGEDSIDIQKDLNKRNKLNTKERQVEIRIGIHYDSYIKKQDDVYGDGILISKLIESYAPHGGIAISESVNNLVKDINDIYSREYIKIEVNNIEIQLYEIYSNLLDWYKNVKNQNAYFVNSKSNYKKAHAAIHNADYSTALK